MVNASNKYLGWVFASAVALITLVSCNGSSGGGSTTPVTPPYTGPKVDVSTLTNDEWAKVTVKGSVTSVTTGAAPIVKFKLTDGSGTPLTGVGTYTIKKTTDTVSTYANISFAIAKLVPGAGGSPSRWVSYIVTSPPTTTADWSPTTPTTDAQGTLVDNGDGTYQYTFLRDITQAKAKLDAFTGYSATKIKADLDDVSYLPGLTHRLTVQVGGAARNTGSVANHEVNTADGTDTNSTGPAINILNPANLIYDFVPATGLVVSATDTQRQVVATTSCNECHSKLGFTFHGNTRVDVQYCMVCHTDQRKYGKAEATAGTTTTYTGSTSKINGLAVGNIPSFIHRLHMGEELSNTGYNYAGVAFNETRYPQQKNCTKCHTASTATPQGDNWKTVPNRLACGSCHDNVNFATGANHSPDALIQATDANCTGCHQPEDIKVYHTYNDVTPLNPFVRPQAVAPQLSNFTYEFLSATLNSSSQPEFHFNIYQDGIKITAFADGVTAGNLATANNIATGKVIANPNFQPIPGFIGGPSFLVQYGMTQDGIPPADFNAARPNVSLGALLIPSGYPKAGTLNYDSTNGYWIATLTGDLNGQAAAYTGWTSPESGVATFSAATAAPIVVPTGAKMVTGMIYGSFTQINLIQYPYTAANPQTYNGAGTKSSLASIGGLLRPAPLQTRLLSGIVGNTARRTIVDADKCNACHERLGTQPAFHGGVGKTLAEANAAHVASPGSAAPLGSGAREKGTACAICHTPNLTNGGWSGNASTFVHAIHGRKQRTDPFTWHAVSATENYGTTMTYPGVLQDCLQCHVPGSYDFSAAENAAALPNLLWTTVATGNFDPASTSAYTFSPYVTQNTTSNYYGKGFSVTSAGVVTQATAPSLVNSPITAACAACHDDGTNVNDVLGVTPRAHMVLNGGTWYTPRLAAGVSAFTKEELCLTCHGDGKVQDIKVVHKNFK